MDTKYNYVFYNISEDYLEPAFMPLRKYPFTRVYEHAFCASKLVQKLFFLWWSKKINDIIKMPCKKLWFKKICKQDFDDNKPICYVFLGGKYLVDEPLLYQYIKGKNPDNRCVILCLDLISKKDWDVQKIKTNTDYIVSYDIGESKKYGIEHFDDVCYGSASRVTEPKNFINDVYFLGFAKDRIEEIHRVYRFLSNHGVKCKFIICGAHEEDKINGEGLIYSKPIPYKENIENVNNSRCVLEIIQGGSTSPTLRMKEAQIYKRKLLTNNTMIRNHSIYNEKSISVFEKTEQIDIDFIKRDIDYKTFHSECFDPINRILFLEKLLGGKE